MSDYKTLMLGLDPSGSFEDRARLAADLADRFSSRLIAAGGRFPVVSVVGNAPFASIAVVAEDEEFAREDVRSLEARYRSVVPARSGDEVRIEVEASTAFILRQARAADLVILPRQGDGDASDARYSINPADIVLEGGRPVLIVPARTAYLRAKRILVAWSDTRECRRAVRDALPFLERADYVTLASIGTGTADSGVSDAAAFLDVHDVNVSVDRMEDVDGRTGHRLIMAAEREGADLIVAGAYGHSRFREWVLGGVTRDLLTGAPVCCFMTH